MNEFEKKYKLLENRKLLKIIEEAENYQPTAVEAAKKELSTREVSADEINSVQSELLERKSKVDERQKKVKNIEDKAKSIGSEFLETIRPIQKVPQTTDRIVNLVVLASGLFSIYLVFTEFGLIKFMFTDPRAKLDVSMALYFMPIFLIPIATLLFWMRNRIGWILMCVFLVYKFVDATAMFLLTWHWSNKRQTSSMSSGDFKIELIEIENQFTHPNLINYLALIAVFGGTLWVISKIDVREIFKINTKAALLTIGLSVTLTSMIIFGLVL